jgi:hypothetical protein
MEAAQEDLGDHKRPMQSRGRKEIGEGPHHLPEIEF